MKRLILPLVALAFLAAPAAASPNSTRTLSPESLETRRTAWGVLPTYNVSGQRFTFARIPRPSLALHFRSVSLDVLVNADGSVEDATITTSSGDPIADFTALACFIGARYSLQPGDSYPTPFVVHQKLEFGPQVIPSSPTTSTFTDRHMGPFASMPPPGAPYYQAWSGAGGGWSGGGSYSNSSSSSSK
jgi:hypothetical protein